MYGRKYMGVERTTFLIDRQGVISRVWEKVKVPGHADRFWPPQRRFEQIRQDHDATSAIP